MRSLQSEWARSSAGEHTLHTGGVTGSIPVAPTMISEEKAYSIARQATRAEHARILAESE